jgi:predicted AlkP superfamily phosphohydrolase/phosphomutase
MESGIVPNILGICHQGFSAPLRTVFPPVTAPAWLSLATGLNPGKTGVFDYINRASADSENMTPISSRYYLKRAVWDFLGDCGHKVGVFNYPTLSPPPPVNGFAISGIGRYGGMDLCYPRELEGELEALTGGYELNLNLRSSRYRKNPQVFFDDLQRVLFKQVKVLRHLLQEKEWNFFFAVLSVTDWMQHVIWKYIDEQHPLFDSRASAPVRDRYEDFWKRIDEFVGELIAILPSDTNLMIVSDHGAGPIDSVFYPNKWLETKGWCTKKSLGWKRWLVDGIRLFSEGSDSKYYSSLIHFFRNRILGIRGTIDLIDRENSLAYSPEHNTMFGCINLTRKGKDTPGFRDELLREIINLPKQNIGINEVNIFLPEEIYSGPFTDCSPDIFFIVNGYSSTVEIDFSKKVFDAYPSIEMRTGGHLPDGVFIAKGGAFTKGRSESVSILDVTPTILALYGIEIPDHMDGRVLTEALCPDVCKEVKIRSFISDKPQVSNETTQNELKEMKKMLKSLGYM